MAISPEPQNEILLRKRRVLLAEAGLGLSAVLWGGDYVILKIALGGIGPFYLNFIRFTLAFIIMLAVFHKKVKSINLRVIWSGFVVGFFMFAAFAALTLGLAYTTAGKSAFLISNYVIIVPFLSWILFKKAPGIRVFIASLLCITGIAFISFQGGALSPGSLSLGRGELFALAGAVFFAMNIVSVEFYVKKVDALSLTLVETGFGALFFLAGGILFETFPSGFSRGSLLALLYLGTLGTAITHVFANLGLKYTSAAHASLFFTLETVFAVIFGFIFLKEAVNLFMLIGFVLIFSAILLAVRNQDSIPASKIPGDSP